MPLFSTPPLVSPKFLHVPLGVGGWSLGYEEQDVWLIVRAISFQDFQPMWSWSTSVTDGQTERQADRQTTSDSKTALYTVVHCTVKTTQHSPQCRSSTVSSFSRVPLRAVGRPHTANSLTRNLLLLWLADIQFTNHSSRQSQTRLLVSSSLYDTIAHQRHHDITHNAQTTIHCVQLK